jgi:hypothetical protein
VRLTETVSHRGAQALLDQLGLGDIVKRSLDAPQLGIDHGSSNDIKNHIAEFLNDAGWAAPVKIEPSLGPELNAQHSSGVVFHTQTGNIARAFYDLMKMQSLHQQGRSPCGILVVPSTTIARVLGGNLANFDRVASELSSLFFHQVSIPVLLAGFE